MFSPVVESMLDLAEYSHTLSRGLGTLSGGAEVAADNNTNVSLFISGGQYRAGHPVLCSQIAPASVHDFAFLDIEAHPPCVCPIDHVVKAGL